MTEDRKSFYATPPPGEEIVISGISAYLPKSENILEFGHNLYNGIDMVTEEDISVHPDVPKRLGRLKANCTNRFDYKFFNINQEEVISLDPLSRTLLEKSYEAVIDAGLHPEDLRGTKTGVYTAASFSEADNVWYGCLSNVDGYGAIGSSKAMFANRISSWLDVHGPSYNVDTACSSALYCVELAYRDLRTGIVDYAIIGTANLCLSEMTTLQFARLGVLSRDGCCRTFDANANGYVRAEAVGCMVLMRAKDAKRIYSYVVHAKNNCDGYKSEGITYPSSKTQIKLLTELYSEVSMDPKDIAYLECHGTGTVVGDFAESTSIYTVFCKDRAKPLKMGSVKTNVGHAEPASGLCSIAKCILLMESGLIPPNLWFKTPRKDIIGFKEGKFQIITQTTPLEGDYVGVSGFGFGGANSHVLLKRFNKQKKNNGLPDDDLPRLVCVSGRTSEAVSFQINDLISRPIDIEYIRLFHDIYRKNIAHHDYRGYVLLQKNIPYNIGHANKYVANVTHQKPSVCFVFSGIGSQWSGMGLTLMKIPVFAGTMLKLNKYLHTLCRLDIIHIITDINPQFYDNPLYAFLGIVALQIGLVDVLVALGVEPDFIVGYSTGELACAYADNCLTAEQTILVAYHRGLALFDSKLIKGSMAVWDLNSNELNNHCPKEIDGQLNDTSNLISEPLDALKKTTKDLSMKEPRLRKELKNIIPNPKRKSKKWICSEKHLNNNDEYCTSDYLANILHTPINLTESFKNLPNNTLIIEISPDNLLVDTLKHSVEPSTFVGALMQRNDHNLSTFFKTLGNLYVKGLNPQLASVYPEVKYPVSCRTPMIAPKIKWDHSIKWPVPKEGFGSEKESYEQTFVLNFNDPKYQNLTGHIIDGRNLYPATGYLSLVWGTLALAEAEIYENIAIMFEDVQFLRATTIPKDNQMSFSVMVQKCTGNFEILESGSVVVAGRIARIPQTPVNLLKLPEVKPIVNNEDLLPLNSRDVYKELRLRGYNYQGDFKGIITTDNSCRVAEVEWKINNWIPFMDNMLQLQILQENVRFLYVPTSIKKLIIYPQEHLRFVKEMDGKSTITVTNYKEYSVIQGGGIQIEGLDATSINRRKPMGEAVLEKQEFVPLCSPISEKYTDIDALRIILQLGLENQPNIKVKVVEMDDGVSTLLSPTMFEVLSDLPLIQASMVVLSKRHFKLPENIQICDKSLASESKADYVVGHDLINNPHILPTISKVLKDANCYIISRENPKNKPNAVPDYDTLCEVFTEGEKLVLLRKKKRSSLKPEIIQITNDIQFPWLEKLQQLIKFSTPTILYSQNESTCGLVGLINCLRKEYLNKTIRAVFIADANAPAFDIKNPFYSNQLDLGLAVNVFKNGSWGGYRHLKLEETRTVTDTAYIDCKTKGDLSSMTWIELPLSTKRKKIIDICYSALNFRDIMTASGKLGIDFIVKGISNANTVLPPECVQGLEFSGYDSDGKRFMGFCGRGALATRVECDEELIFPVPDHWTLEDAATVPIVYATVYYSLVKWGMRKGHSVLIHAGTGGVGLSAINVALHYECEVFTTVGTQAKRDFIKKIFPQIKDSHIGNSRDTSFEQMVMQETKGRGVDFVLNSLAEEKLLASVRCLAEHGKFMEIGKFDLSKNSKLGMEVFMRGASFHGIMLDNAMYGEVPLKREISKMIRQGIEDGAIKPLPRTVFGLDNLEVPFRYMAAGKHMGKVLLKIRGEEMGENVVVSAIPKLYVKRNKTIIIVGGLGGFGLELANWLIQRGCNTLVLSSRHGLKKGYQAIRVQKWRQAGINVQISSANISTKDGCIEMIQFAKKFGPVDGIYNLAVLLRDAIFENQTIENFQTSFAGKVLGTKYLDEVSRTLCPELRHFVVFSSVSCGRGNAGQTNYGMANSVMERICEERHAAGYPALAVQWGAIGEVGLVADMQDDDTLLEIGGTLQQKLQSCFDAMDIFVKQKAPVVASMVVAEKKSGFGAGGSLLEAVTNILGIRDFTTISKHANLAEIGMDSMMAVEIKQTLEREFELFLTAQDIRNLTFSKLMEIQSAQSEDIELAANTTQVQENVFKMFVRTLGDENHPSEPIVKLPSQYDDSKNTKNTTPLFFIAGIEGQSTVFETITSNLISVCYGLQVPFTDSTNSIAKLTKKMIRHIKSILRSDQDYHIVAYSYGSVLATEIARELEQLGHNGRCLFIDGAPAFIKMLIDKQFALYDDTPPNVVESKLLAMILSLFVPGSITKILAELEALPDWSSRVNLTMSKIPDGVAQHSEKYLRTVCDGLLARFHSLIKYRGPTTSKLDAKIGLIRPSIQVLSDISDDYDLSLLVNCTDRAVPVTILDGDHFTILENEKLPSVVNDFFQE